jgi:hypothetical protein
LSAFLSTLFRPRVRAQGRAIILKGVRGVRRFRFGLS